jgi:transcriptional regulator with XRE-family HTH domain
MTQVEVAERMKVSKQAVSNLESGTMNPSLRTLEKYAKALGVRLVLEKT